MKKILFIVFFFTTACGYQSIYLNNNPQNFEFFNITTEGEIDINRKITNSISFKENKSNKMLNDLVLTTSFKIDETSKDKKGRIKTYRSSILVNLTIIKNDNIIKNKNFSEEFMYNTKDNKFELIEYQTNIKDDLINKVIEEIVLFLNVQ